MKKVLITLMAMSLLGVMPLAANASDPKPVNLWVTQTDNPDPVVENGFVVYTVLIGNKVPQPANRIVVDFTLSSGQYVAASGTKWACNAAGTSAHCQLGGALPATTNAAPITLTAQAPSAQTAAQITNVAVVSTSDPDYAEIDPSDNTSSETTTIKGGSDLTIDQQDVPDPVTAGNTVRYAITANNDGDTATATGVKVTATASSGIVTSASGTGWSCSTTSSSAVCSLAPGIGPNQHAAIIDLLVKTPFSNVTTTMTDTVKISATNGDTNQSNNTNVETTSVSPSGKGSASGWVPASGGSVTTCVGEPSPSDGTCATVILPAGPGGVVTVEEGPSIPICQSAGCAGNSVNVIVPDGYNPDATSSNPIVVLINIDVTLISASSNDPTRPIYVEKDAGVQAVSLPSCSARVPGLPCIRSQTRSLSGDYQGAIEMFSGDPIFDTGDTVNKVTG
ncbi:MAG: hypothetical protein ABR507_02505 [Actinomycetota bacterium]|nr:DUF11 domain-containing protein [Actinomycetota bacterium]